MSATPLCTALPAELPDDVNLDALVAADQLRFYFLRGSFPYAANLAVAGLSAVGVWNLLSHARILGWLCAIAVVSATRFVLRRSYLRRQPDDTARWQRLATGGALLNGVAWGSAALVLYPHGSFAAQTLLTLIVGGMCAGTFFLGGSYTTPSFAFVLFATPPLAVRLLVDRDRQHVVMAALLVLFAATMVMVARASCAGFKEAARLRFGLAALGRELSRRADELEQFAGRVAHDIRGPLSATALGLDYAIRCNRAPEVHDVLCRVQRSTTRIGTIVDGLLRFARAGARPEPGVCTRVRPVLDAILGELAPLAAAADIELTLTLSSERAVVVGHAGVLTSLVENLVRNALKYMGQRPRKRIDVRVIETRDARGGLVRFEIEDSGPGIDAALLGRLFDPHVRGRDTGQPGIGLGLATVKRISEAHGGSVGVRSTPDVGSIFWFELPQADEAGGGTEAAAARPAAVSLTGASPQSRAMHDGRRRRRASAVRASRQFRRRPLSSAARRYPRACRECRRREATMANVGGGVESGAGTPPGRPGLASGHGGGPSRRAPIRPKLPLALVAAGAGARGAYEAGVLMPLLDQIAKQDKEYKPTIFVGTSAGAINAVKLASLAHLDPCHAAEQMFAAWRRVHWGLVLRSALRSLPLAAARYFGRLLGLQPDLPSLLDTTPLRRTLEDATLIDWQALHRNVADGRVDVVAVVTTEYGTNRTKVFFETAIAKLIDDPKLCVPSDDLRAVDYVRTTLTPEHVLASASIPVAFPPVLLHDGYPTWNMDGGVRLNAPLRPAITFGANGLVVVASDPCRYRSPLLRLDPGRQPTVQDALCQLLHGAMSDRMIEDLHALAHINEIVERACAPAPIPKSRATSTSTLDANNRIIPFIFGGPLINDELCGVAAEALDACFHGVHRFKHLDLLALSWLLGAGTDTRPELLSYLLFEPEFIDAAIQRGQEDAEMIVQTDGELWRTSFDAEPAQVVPAALMH